MGLSSGCVRWAYSEQATNRGTRLSLCNWFQLLASKLLCYYRNQEIVVQSETAVLVESCNDQGEGESAF